MPRIIPAAVARAVSVGDWVIWARRSSRVPLERLGQAEVEELDLSVLGDLDVGGLEVPVDDPLLVGGLERFGDLPGDGEGFLEGQGAIPDLRVEAFAFGQLHDKEVAAGDLLEGVHGRDAGVVQGGEGAGLALEAGDAVLVLEELLRQDLDGDVPLELRIAGPIDLSHAPGTERGEDLVRSEAGAGGDGQ